MKKWESDFKIFRQIVLFLTGIGILLYAVVSTGHDIPFIVAGLILVGIVPIDSLLGRWPRTREIDDRCDDEAEKPSTDPPPPPVVT